MYFKICHTVRVFQNMPYFDATAYIFLLLLDDLYMTYLTSSWGFLSLSFYPLRQIKINEELNFVFVIFKRSNCSFCGVASMDMRQDKLVIDIFIIKVPLEIFGRFIVHAMEFWHAAGMA